MNQPLHPDVLRALVMLNGALDTLSQTSDDLARADAKAGAFINDPAAPYERAVLEADQAYAAHSTAQDTVNQLTKRLVAELTRHFAPFGPELRIWRSKR